MANESFFNATLFYDSLLNDTQFATESSLFNVTQINGSLPNETGESLPNGLDICNKTIGPYPSSWDMIFTTEVLLNCIVCVLGIFGNIYALTLVFGNKTKSFVHSWRKSMVICDLLLLVCDLNQITVARIGRSFLTLKNPNVSLYSYVWVLLYPIRKMIETASVWITVGVSIERCIFMYNPKRAVSLCRDRMPGIFFLFITIFAASMNFPRFREYKVKDCHDLELNITSHEVWPESVSDVIADYRYVLNWILICVIHIVPFLILIISNSLLWRVVHGYNFNKKKLEEDMKPEVNVVRMIVCFTIVFCVCRFPKLVEEVYSSSDISVEFMTPFANLMLSINSAVNFIIYTLF